jgi:hypothetical protein
LKKKRGFGIGFVIFRAPTLASYQNNSKIILKKLMSYLSCSQIFGWLCQCGYTTKMKKKKPWSNNCIIQKIYCITQLLLLALPISFLYPTHLHKYETNVGTFKQILSYFI